MWPPVQQRLQQFAASTMPPAVPLRKSALNFDTLAVGFGVRFSASCPLRPLAGELAPVIAVRQYRFGEDVLKSFQLQVTGGKQYFLTVAEDEQGNYLSISRALNEAEQDSWFGRDALSFFTEQSSAKSIRCKADLMIDGDWAAARYSKTVDWVEGSIANVDSPRLARSFHYNLLVNESGEKALEIEHDDLSGENRVFLTVYRPTEDIVAIERAAAKLDVTAPAPTEAPLFVAPESAMPPQQPKQRPDFRRLDEVSFPEIHIERTRQPIIEIPEPQPELPSFLLAREGNYLSLDEVIPPEAERIRVSLSAARNLIDHAITRNVRVRDVLRNMLGLQSALSEEVLFEIPLSDEDYRTLAMRYKLRPDHRVEIRSRLEEELRSKFSAIAKP